MAENISNIDSSMVSKAVHFLSICPSKGMLCTIGPMSTVENAQCAVSNASMNHTATYAVDDNAICQG